MRAKKDVGYELSKQALAAEAKLERDGLALPRRPKGDLPILTTRPADLDDASLISLMAQFTAWHDYLNGQLSMAVIDERYAESAVSLAEAKSLIVAWGTDKESVNVAKAQRETDPEVIQLKEVQLGSYAHRKLIEMLVSNAERDGATLSRELSRRLGRQEVNERRTMRWNP